MLLSGFLFFLGLIIGSFLNAFIYRYQNKVTLGGRSFCPNCKKKIAWYDNIPLISWLFLSGRCRCCKKPIPIQYPTVELLTGLTFLLAAVYSTQGKIITQWFDGILNLKFEVLSQILILNFLMFIVLLLIVSCLMLIAVYDIKTQEIPNGFNLTFAIAALAYLLLSGLASPFFIQDSIYHLLSGLIFFLFLWAIVLYSKETWMGGGDAKLGLGIGVLLGPIGTFIAFFSGSIIGAIYGTILILLKKAGPKTAIPFGPFLVLGTFIAMFFGSLIFTTYVKIFLGM